MRKKMINVHMQYSWKVSPFIKLKTPRQDNPSCWIILEWIPY